MRRLQPDTDRKNRNEAGGTKFGNALCGAGQACKEQLFFILPVCRGVLRAVSQRPMVIVRLRRPRSCWPFNAHCRAALAVSQTSTQEKHVCLLRRITFRGICIILPSPIDKIAEYFEISFRGEQAERSTLGDCTHIIRRLFAVASTVNK